MMGAAELSKLREGPQREKQVSAEELARAFKSRKLRIAPVTGRCIASVLKGGQ